MKKLFACVLVTLVLLSLAACTRIETVTVTPTAYSTTTSTVTVTSTISFAPTLQELQDAGSACPEIPRIRAEGLKMKMDEAYPTSKPTAGIGNFRWSDFTLIGVHPEVDVDAYGSSLNHIDQILGSIIVPFQFYKVGNPIKDLTPADLEKYKAEQAKIALAVAGVPKDKPVILYDKTSDDGAACAMAKLLVDQGFDPGQITVLWKGFNYWYHDLQYPVLSGDWRPA
jgi:hypothetical protein